MFTWQIWEDFCHNFVPSDGNLRVDNSKVGQEAAKPGIARFDIPDCFTLVKTW